MKLKLMKIFFFCVLSFLIVSCNNSELRIKTIHSGFIEESGIYNLPRKKINILVRELKDGSIIFAIRNSQNKILFQQSLNETFSQFHFWKLYVDENANIWYYNSDYISSKALLFNEKTQLYEIKDFCSTQFQLPFKFKKAIEHTIDKNCQSLKKQ